MQTETNHDVAASARYAFINEWAAPRAEVPVEDFEIDHMAQWAELVSPHVLVLNLE